MFRRHEDTDNPAWPGLVDIFAFTLAFLLIIWFANNLPQKVENLEKETQDLSARITSLTGEKAQLRNLNQRLQNRLALANQSNQDLSAQIQGLESSLQGLGNSLKDLDSQRTALKQANLGLNSEVQRLQDANAFLRDIGRQDWQELLKMLQKRLAGLQMEIIPNEQEKEIEIHGKPRITFETLQYELSGADRQRLERLAPILLDLRQKKPFFITINGTADPRELHDAAPPRNNTELSALRAATVAAMLENASPGLGRYLRVMGLGVKGQKKSLAPEDDPDRFYQKYRTVSLVLKIDVAALMQADTATRTN
jgi:flagellar motor protein MotB